MCVVISFLFHSVSYETAVLKTRLLLIFLWTICIVEHCDMEMSYDHRVCVCGLKCSKRTGRGKLFPELVLTYSFRVPFPWLKETVRRELHFLLPRSALCLNLFLFTFLSFF